MLANHSHKRTGRRGVFKPARNKFRRSRDLIKRRAIEVEDREMSESIVDDIQALLVHDRRRFTEIAEDAGLSSSTIRRLFYMDTRNPMSRTIFRALSALHVRCVMKREQ